MYGYIRTYTPELKVREQEYYRAAYCGLCRAMGKCTGQCSRLTLSYDFTFFALMRMALTGETPTARRRRCLLHPLRRRPMIEPCDALTLSAYASALLVYHKNLDDRKDERGGKRLRATLLAPYTHGLRRRARRRDLARMDDDVAAIMTRLSELEASRPPSVDRPAEVFGELMAYLLSWGLDGREQTLAKTIGRHAGRWVYILDAADDFKEDVKKRRYNPLACLYNDPTMTTLSEHKRQEIRTALTAELVGIENALDLIEITDRDLDGVLKNILYHGMPAAVEKVLFCE